EAGRAQPHPRGAAVEISGATRLVGKQGVDAQLRITALQRVTHLQTQHTEQPRLDPDAAGLRYARGYPLFAEGLLTDTYLPAQRIARSDRLDAGQLHLGFTCSDA